MNRAVVAEAGAQLIAIGQRMLALGNELIAIAERSTEQHRVWFSRVGDAKGMPWRLNGKMYASIIGRGEIRTEFNPEGFSDLPDRPKAVLVIEGECEGE